jgi:hypothetical protein
MVPSLVAVVAKSLAGARIEMTVVWRRIGGGESFVLDHEPYL